MGVKYLHIVHRISFHVRHLNQTDQITHIASAENLLKNTFWSYSSCFLVIVWLLRAKSGWIAVNRFITSWPSVPDGKYQLPCKVLVCNRKKNFCFCIELFRERLSEKCMRHSQKVLGWFWVHCSLRKFERMSREAMDVCLQVLKESNKSRFDSYNVRNSVLNISHITLMGLSDAYFSNNLSQKYSCIQCSWTSGNSGGPWTGSFEVAVGLHSNLGPK